MVACWGELEVMLGARLKFRFSKEAEVVEWGWCVLCVDVILTVDWGALGKGLASTS